MKKHISRRGFIKKSAVALSTVAVFDLTGIIGTGRENAFKALASEGLKENNMPHVSVKLWPGRSEQTKQRLADAIVEDVVNIIGCGEESFRSPSKRSIRKIGRKKSMTRSFAGKWTLFTKSRDIPCEADKE